MPMDGAGFAFHDLAPSEESFRDAILGGLSREPKSLPAATTGLPLSRR